MGVKCVFFYMHMFVCVICVCGGVFTVSGAAIRGSSSSIPLHIVLKLLSTGSPCFSISHSLSPSLPLLLSVSFTGSLLHDRFSPARPGESWERSYILRSWRLYMCVCVWRNSLHVSLSILQTCVHASVCVWEVIYVLQFVRTCKRRDIGFRRKSLRAILPH